MLATRGYNPDILTCLANLSSDEVFTPPQMANRVLDQLPAELWSDPYARFLDPACKSGVFLREIAKRLNVGLEAKYPNQEVRLNHIFKNQLFGIAITELTASLARRSLYCSKNANGVYSVCSIFADVSGNVRFRRIEHDWSNGRCRFCGASEAEYKRDEELESHAYEFIHNETPKEFVNMKFDVIVGNPPYQLSDQGYGTSATPIFQAFVGQGKLLNPRFLTMIIPARWYSGGKGLDEFRNEMLHDDRLREIHDFPDASAVFPGVQIKGGVCFFLWDRDSRGPCTVYSYDKDSLRSKMKRPLLESGAETFVRYNEAISILAKVNAKAENSIRALVSARKPFGLPTTFRGKDKPFEGAVKLFQNGGIGYISAADITANRDLVCRFKVFIPPLGSGSDSFPHSILGKPFVGGLNTACTETYLAIGAFDDVQHANNLAQ